jgi:proteasome lid subunit RPN8/RPN11
MAVKRFRRGEKTSSTSTSDLRLDAGLIRVDELPLRPLTATDRDRGQGFAVVFAPAVWDQIIAHSRSTTDLEVGGVMLGQLYRDQAGPYVLIHAAIPALRAAQRATSVTFTADTWTQINQTLDRDHPDAKIVGWYHTHPGFGIFLSDMDQFICRSFFDLPHQIATVIDPIARTDGTFHWRAGKLVSEPAICERPASTTPARTTAVWKRPLALFLCFILAGAAIWGLLHLADVLSSPVDQPINQQSPP